MSLNILLVGSHDRQLEEVLRACGMTARVLARAELATLAQPSGEAARRRRARPARPVASAGGAAAAQAPAPDDRRPDRRDRGSTRRCCSRRCAPGVNEFVADPLSAPSSTPRSSGWSRSGPSATPAARCSRFRRQGRRRDDDRGGERRDGARQLVPGSTLLIDLHVANGDAAVFLGAEPRFSIVDALENTHRLDEAFFRGLIVKTKCGRRSAGLVRSGAWSRRWTSGASGRCSSSRRATIATSCSTSRDPTPRSSTRSRGVAQIVVVANQELATVRSASRMATTLRQRYGKDKLSVVISRADRLAEIGHEDVERAVGVDGQAQFPERLPPRAGGAEQRAARSRSRTTTSCPARSSNVRRVRWPAWKSRRQSTRPPARFGLFGSRKTATAGAQVA